MSGWRRLSDEELDSRLADVLRSVARAARYGPAEEQELLAAVRSGLGDEAPQGLDGRLPAPALIGAAGIIALALVALVALFVRQPTVGPAATPAPPSTTVRSGDFTLTLRADKAAYAPDEAIEVEAVLTYEGAQAAIDVVGVEELVMGFGIRQLDGDMEMGAGWNEPCLRHTLRQGEPRNYPYRKSAGWSDDDPHADFFASWVRDPALRLPPGTWQITAYSEFFTGSCGGSSGRHIEMRPSITIYVGVPAPTPVLAEATPPNTYSWYHAAEFAAGLPEGRFHGRSVLVDGAIAALEADPESCLAADRCLMGRLLGTGGNLEVHSRWMPVMETDPGATEREVEGVEWRWWARALGPVEQSRLLLHVADDGTVEYVGREYEEHFSWGLPTLASPDYTPEMTAFDEVIIWPAWLTGIHLAGSCAPPAPGTYISGLPQRYCGGPSWLADSPFALNPDGFFPPAGGVQMQGNAYNEFAPRTAERIAPPVPGLWAISRRLEGGGCPDQTPPCWQWNVVARISYEEPGPAMPVATPTSTPQPVTPQPATPPRSPLAPVPTATPDHACAYADGASRAEISLRDHANVVATCQARIGEQVGEATASNPDGDLTRLHIEWPVSAVCDQMPVLVDLRRPRSDPDEFAARIVRLPAEAGGCWPQVRSQSITLQLAAPVRADDVYVQVLDAGGSARQGTSAGSFELSIESPAWAIAGEPIDVRSVLAYDGSTRRVSVSGHPAASFGFLQLDGRLEMSSAYSTDCPDHVLDRERPLSATWSPVIDASRDEPDANFYYDWAESSELWLPVGRWLLYSYSVFAIGDCLGEDVELMAATIIDVLAPDAARPCADSALTAIDEQSGLTDCMTITD